MLTIDVRMIKQSGIGTYIVNLLPHVIESISFMPITLLGRNEELSQFPWIRRSNINVIEFNEPIYSIQEQVGMSRKIPKQTKLFWSPHYNIPLLYSGKLLVTVHDVFHLAMKEYVGGIHKRMYAKLMFNALSRKASHIICVSDFTKNQFIQYTGSAKSPITTIHNGVNSSWFRPADFREQSETPYLLYVGNVKPHKNLGNLLTAFSKVMHLIPHNLVIVGRREGFITGDQAIVNQSEALGDRIQFTGYISDEELKKYFSNASAFVFPSVYEGFGLPPLEAMACGCPVLVSNRASLPEVCGDAAQYFDPIDPKDIAEKIMMVVNDRRLRDKLVQAGLEQSQKFNWDISRDRTMEKIRSLLIQ